jgi:hypothetical protein
MLEAADCEVKIRLRGSQYLALRHLARADERSLSGYIRKVLIDHVEQVSAQTLQRDRDAPGDDRD